MKPVNGYIMLSLCESKQDALYVPAAASKYRVFKSDDERFKVGDIILSKSVKQYDDYLFTKAEDIVGVENA